MPDNGDYAHRKAFFNKVLTVYGRKPVLESLRDTRLSCHALHLAQSNRSGGIINDIETQARTRGIPVHYHERNELARISKNSRQDQGVALDILCPAFKTLDEYLANADAKPQRLLALDGITNPQNLGMIIRSAAAGSIDGILLPVKGCAALGPLVIKASAGTVYRAPLVHCASLPTALVALVQHRIEICALIAGAKTSLFEYTEPERVAYILGNESDGITQSAQAAATRALSIPMSNGVESLNVAVTASLIAYAGYLDR